MNITALRPVQTAAPLFHIQNLNLAPEGWRPCVEKLAEGFFEVVGEHTYCLNCGSTVDGKQGHSIDCVTMVARRMLANEPLLHARLRATAADVYVRLSTAFPDAEVATVPTANQTAISAFSGSSDMLVVV